jgi:hypothetical protein
MNSARKLIRDAKTKEWLTRSGEFSRDVSAAHELTSLAQASRICRGYPERRLEIVLYFKEPKEEVILPIGEIE